MLIPKTQFSQLLKSFTQTCYSKTNTTFLWGIRVPLDSQVINTFYDLHVVIICMHSKFVENMTIKK